LFRSSRILTPASRSERENATVTSEAIRSLRAKEILRAINCFQNRVDACIAKNGAHFEHLVA